MNEFIYNLKDSQKLAKYSEPPTQSSAECDKLYDADTPKISPQIETGTLSQINESTELSQIRTQIELQVESSVIQESIENFDIQSVPKNEIETLDSNREMDNIRKVLLLLTKMYTSSYLVLKKKLDGIYILLNKLLRSERSELTNKNMLSGLFLRLFVNFFKCPTLDNNKLHELFKLGINCYVLNFKYFTKTDRIQYTLLFQFIYDVIYLNVRLKTKKCYGERYLLIIKDHKYKNQLTLLSNKDHVQILLHYLLQLLFSILGSKEFSANDKNDIREKLRKLLAFLILNGNTELLRDFRQKKSGI